LYIKSALNLIYSACISTGSIHNTKRDKLEAFSNLRNFKWKKHKAKCIALYCLLSGSQPGDDDRVVVIR